MIELEGTTVTTLSDADQPAIDDLYARCADFLALDPNAGPPVRLLHGLPDDAVPERQHVFGFWEGAALIGTVEVLCGYVEPRDWWIGLLMLDPRYRRSGLGHRAAEAVLAWARASRVAERLWIAVAPANEHALRFWKREGFAERSVSGAHILLSRTID
jgi:GNAT superfamily N-acetyltransferase